MARRGGDHAWCIREAMLKYGKPVILVTLTAPGEDVLPTGPDGRCAHEPLAAWCATLPERWHRLRDQARKRSLRASRASSGLTVLSYAWQLQARGAPHLHLVVPAGPLGHRFASALKECAGAYGFGFVDIRSGTGSASAVGSYLSRYLTRDLEKPDREYGQYLPRRPAYVDRRIARAAGVSVRIARAVRRIWVYANVDRDPRLIRGGVFADERQSALAYYWYRVGRRGRENVPLSWAFGV
jgi:hypothetical protein